MRRVLELVERVAPRGVSVLLRGESGTGKDLVAKLLHLRSGRAGPLVALNCAAIPESLLESELFGIEGGVATGVQARRGKFELAHGGTLFLDEIGDLQPQLQAKLLRALQEREVVRVGGHQAIPVDVRLVAATNRNLETLFAEGRFREDLYYRLKGVEIELPPLRERREDIPHLVRHFAEEFCRRERIPAPAFDREALALLLAYDYPGNVRELQNVVEGALSLAEGRVEVGPGALAPGHPWPDGTRAGRPRSGRAAPHPAGAAAHRRQQVRRRQAPRGQSPDPDAPRVLTSLRHFVCSSDFESLSGVREVLVGLSRQAGGAPSVARRDFCRIGPATDGAAVDLQILRNSLKQQHLHGRPQLARGWQRSCPSRGRQEERHATIDPQSRFPLPRCPSSGSLVAGTVVSFGWLLVQDRIHPLVIYLLQLYLSF